MAAFASIFERLRIGILMELTQGVWILTLISIIKKFFVLKYILGSHYVITD